MARTDRLVGLAGTAGRRVRARRRRVGDEQHPVHDISVVQVLKKRDATRRYTGTIDLHLLGRQRSPAG